MAENKEACNSQREYVDPMKEEGELLQVSDVENNDDGEPKTATVLSGFFYFCKVERANVRAEFPEWSSVDVGKELGRRWNNMDDEARFKYVDMLMKERQTYEREMANVKHSQSSCSITETANKELDKSN